LLVKQKTLTCECLFSLPEKLVMYIVSHVELKGC